MKNLNDRDKNIIAHISDYCGRIENCKQRFGNSFETFASDYNYQDAVSMPIFQIGELTKHLSEEFKEQHKSEIPWKEIRGMRNLFAHNYLGMSIKEIWEVATTDIPTLNKFCDSVLSDVDVHISSERKNEKPSVFKEVEKIKAEQKNDPQKTAPAKSRNNNVDIDD